MPLSLVLAALLLTRPGAHATPAAPGAMQQDTACHADALPRSLRLGPTFTPYTRAPELKNREDVLRAREALYPAQLRARGVSGATIVWALIDRCGALAQAQLRQSSGNELLDSAGLRVARLMRWSPALQGQWPVDVWVQLPILFGTRPYPPPQPVPPPTLIDRSSDVLPRLAAPGGWVGPSLLNAGEVDARLRDGYAALGGQGGAALTLALRIDVQGRVTRAAIATSSGSPPVDSLPSPSLTSWRSRPPWTRSAGTPPSPPRFRSTSAPLRRYAEPPATGGPVVY